MEILKNVFKKSLFVILPAIVLSAFLIEPRKIPLGILMGWLLGIFNLRQLTRNIEGLIGSEKATVKLVFLSMTRLLVLFAAIFLLVYYRVVNVFGLLFGFTVVFVLILIEGARVGKSGSDNLQSMRLSIRRPKQLASWELLLRDLAIR
jgi:hypothetical protein